MGVEYKRFLIPRPNAFLPDAATVAALVDALRRERWLIDPASPQLAAMPFRMSRPHRHAQAAGYFVDNADGYADGSADVARHVANIDRAGVRLCWPVESAAAAGLRYPLVADAGYTQRRGTDRYYRFEMHFCADYLFHISEAIEPFASNPQCRCGAALVYEFDPEPFFDQRIAMNCPVCGTPFDATGLLCRGRDIFTGEAFELPGGATYRFALKIDCGKDFGDVAPPFEPELKSLVERVLQRETYEVADFS
jgi:hypothetical protein